MYMDDVKMFAKNKKKLESVIRTVRIFSQDIGTEFGVEKCGKFMINKEKEKKKKKETTEEIELPNQERSEKKETAKNHVSRT